MNAPDAQTQLKACPLCNSTRITIWGIRDGMRAVCKDCKCEGPPAFHGPNLDTVERAIAAWNTRANPDADALAKALEDMWDTACTSASSTPSKAAFLKAHAALTAYRANGAS